MTATATAASVDTSPERSPRPIPRLLWHQSRYDLLRSWRNRQSRFFSMFLPVVLLVIFTTLFGRFTVYVTGGSLKQTYYYVPGLTALGIISAACMSLAVTIVTERQSGVLKRRRSKPVPPWILIGGRCFTALATVCAVTLVLIGVGAFGYDTVPRPTAIPGLVFTVVVGTAAFACIGFGITPFLRDPESAQTTVQAVALPLYFISTIFLPPHLIPPTLRHVAAIFPLEHLSHALFVAYNPHLTGAGFALSDLAIVTAWGVVGLFVALRRFEWMPIPPRPRSGHRANSK